MKLTLQTLWEEGAESLRRSGIGEAELDAKYLLFEAFQTDMVHFLMHRNEEVKDEDSVKRAVADYRRMIEKRSERIPLQQITGSREFMGLEFSVNKGFSGKEPGSSGPLHRKRLYRHKPVNPWRLAGGDAGRYFFESAFGGEKECGRFDDCEAASHQAFVGRSGGKSLEMEAHLRIAGPGRQNGGRTEYYACGKRSVLLSLR